MNQQESVAIIQTLIQSLSENPTQFNVRFSTKVIGTNFSATNGGTGANISVSGQGNTGLVSRVSTADTNSVEIERIANGAVDERLNSELNACLGLMQDLIGKIESGSLTDGDKQGYIQKFKESWLPNIVVSMISLAIGM